MLSTEGLINLSSNRRQEPEKLTSVNDTNTLQLTLSLVESNWHVPTHGEICRYREVGHAAYPFRS